MSTDRGFAAYVQASCRCRRGFVCAFCRKWGVTGRPRRARRCRDCAAQLTRPELQMIGQCDACLGLSS